jgi:hypothetical protein
MDTIPPSAFESRKNFDNVALSKREGRSVGSRIRIESLDEARLKMLIVGHSEKRGRKRRRSGKGKFASVGLLL